MDASGSPDGSPRLRLRTFLPPLYFWERCIVNRYGSHPGTRNGAQDAVRKAQWDVDVMVSEQLDRISALVFASPDPPSAHAAAADEPDAFLVAAAAPLPPKRARWLSTAATRALRAWLLEHVDAPYPTPAQKQRLARAAGLSVTQVSNWFINARRRVLRPIEGRRDE
eukprot:m51a1_g11217 putative homeobox protein meis3 (167) ;mRNA; f:26811-27688